MTPARARVLQISIDPRAEVALYEQVYAEIRSAIVSGRLRPGVRLPSTRTLSNDLHVSRSTIVIAYERLRAEGYIESRVGDGTRVSRSVPDAMVRSDAAVGPGPGRVCARPLARRVASLPNVPDLTGDRRPRSPRAFRSAVPAVDAFPIATWAEVVNQALRRVPPRHLSYGDTLGYKPLREAVADYLGAARGVRCSPDQVMIVAGAQQALSLCATVLLNPGDQAWMEDPGYYGIRGVLVGADATVVAVPVDAEGLCVSEGRRCAPDAKVAFVTPARQLPLGVTLSMGRRQELLAWAEETQAWVVEDDYDGEFRYTSRPLGALQGLDTNGSVIYVGTFTKIMFPALRLGYMVVPDSAREAFVLAQNYANFHPPHLEQAAMARFIREGHFERHVRRMRSLYAGRRDRLVSALREYLVGRLVPYVADAGMGMVAWLGPEDDDEAVTASAAAFGVDVLPLSRTAIEHRCPPGLILGFSGISESEIDDGVRSLARAIEHYDKTTGQVAR